MAGRGPAPKATPLSRANDEARKKQGFEQIRADGKQRGPDLPESVEWHPQTVRWWATWRLSPQAQSFTATDWDFLLDTAMLHTLYWSGTPLVASELRLRVAKFGATVEDRMRLRMEAAGADQDHAAGKQSPRKPTPAKSSDARRRRLLKVVKDDG
jgi:hypothetical protein